MTQYEVQIERRTGWEPIMVGSVPLRCDSMTMAELVCLEMELERTRVRPVAVEEEGEFGTCSKGGR